MTPEKNSRKGGGVRVTWPSIFWSLNANSSKMAKDANFKFGTQDPRWSPNMSPEKQESLAIAKTTARCAQYMGALRSLRVLTTHPATFPEICKRLLFRSILRMCIQNLKFVALSVPEIIVGTQKIWAVPRYAHAPFSLKFLKSFCSYGPCEYTCQIWSS